MSRMKERIIDETDDTITIQYSTGIMTIDKKTGIMLSWVGNDTYIKEK